MSGQQWDSMPYGQHNSSEQFRDDYQHSFTRRFLWAGSRNSNNLVRRDGEVLTFQPGFGPTTLFDLKLENSDAPAQHPNFLFNIARSRRGQIFQEERHDAFR